jgi:hypothetical protein
METNLPTDVTITFADGETEKTMKLHKAILAGRCHFFNMLFTVANNIYRDKFTIYVEDASVAVILMKSFYGQVIELSPVELLKMIKIKSYFCTDIVQSDLYDLEIPPEYFDLLLEIINLPEITINNRLISTIRKNLPVDYDMRRMDIKIRKMLHGNIYHHCEIKIWVPYHNKHKFV